MAQPAETPPLLTVEALQQANRRRRWRRRGLVASLALICVAGVAGWDRWHQWPTKVVLRSEEDAWPLAFGPDGRVLATSSQVAISLWDVQTGRKRSTFPNPAGKLGGRAAFAPDGKTLAIVQVNHPAPSSIVLADAGTGEIRLTIATPHVAVYDLAFIEGGRLVRALLGDVPQVKRLRTWDATTGAEVADFSIAVPTRGYDVAFDPVGSRLALIPRGGQSVRLWDVVSGKDLTDLTDPAARSSLDRGLAFSPDGQTLAVGRQDGSIELWEIATRQIRQRLPGHSGGFGSWGIQFAPDGRSLVSEGRMFQRNPIRLAIMALGSVFGGRGFDQGEYETISVDLANGRTVARASSAIHPMFSPDGRWVVTRELDFTARIRPNPVPPR